MEERISLKIDLGIEWSMDADIVARMAEVVAEVHRVLHVGDDRYAKNMDRSEEKEEAEG